MKKIKIRQSGENAAYVTFNGKVIYLDDSIGGKLFVEAGDDETEKPIKLEVRGAQ